jgi:glycine cleavage system T protein
VSAGTTHARVVIVGGGVAGCSIAWHLAERGWTDVVVLERGQLTGGSTFHSAGLVGQLRASVSLTRMNMASVALYDRLEAAAARGEGPSPGWRRVGSLRLASSPARLRELKRQAGWARTVGLDAVLLGPAEARALFPPMSADGVEGALHLPTDGYLDPSGLAHALAAGARARGVRIHEGVVVTAIDVGAGRVTAVRTPGATIRAETAVVAAGIWTPTVARLAGVTIPLVPVAHQYLVTAPIAGLPRGLPTLRDPDHLVYFREEVGGLLMGGYERAPAPWGLDGIPDDFVHRLLAPDWDRFGPLMDAAVLRVPALGKAEVVRLVNGPEAFTPDGEFVLGEAPGVRGLHVAAGFCAHGIAGAGGVGQVIADWIVDGQAPMDLWRMDVRRFGVEAASAARTLARVVEGYATYYDIREPLEERRSGRPLRVSPVHPRLAALGAVFGEKAGWERPNRVAANAQGDAAAVAAEHRATRERVALFDLTSFSKAEVRGPAALGLLQRLADNQLDTPEGAVTYTQLLNPRGGIECDLTITRLGTERFLVVTGAAFGPHDFGWIRDHVRAGEAVEIEDVGAALACLGLWGPRAREVLARLTRAPLDSAGFPYLAAREIAVGPVPAVRALRVTYVGELGWELYVPVESALALWDALWEAGRASGIAAAGYHAIDTLRLEKGYRYWSADIGPDDTPWEAGLGFCVRLDKGDFVGRDALIAQRGRGVARRLVGLVLAEGEAVARGGEPLLSGGGVAGRVTSGGRGHTVGRALAYGYVPAPLAGAGTTLAVEIDGEVVAATVVTRPPWDPGGARPRA